MAFYAVYEIVGGKLVSQTTILPPSLPDGLASKEFVGPPTNGYVWDRITLDYIPRPLEAGSLLSRNEFWKRFTPAEMVDIEEGSFSYSADSAAAKRKKAEVRAAMRLWLALDPLDLSGGYVTVPMATLVSAGVLTQARADAILAPAME